MSRGHDRERKVRELLEAEGWVVLRAAGSLGVADLVALRSWYRPRLIEVKSTIGPYDHFGPVARALLAEQARQAGADALLAWWPARKPLQWISAAEWPKGATG